MRLQEVLLLPGGCARNLQDVVPTTKNGSGFNTFHEVEQPVGLQIERFFSTVVEAGDGFRVLLDSMTVLQGLVSRSMAFAPEFLGYIP